MLNLGRSAFLKNNDNGKIKIKKTIVKIPSNIKYITKVSSKVLETLTSYKIDESDMFDIRLCVEEAVINAIIHGNSRDETKPVKIAYWIEENKLNVEVEDKGKGFDYKHMPDPTANDNIMKGSGRGVYLINNLMDEVEHNESGNKIKMMKYLKEKK